VLWRARPSIGIPRLIAAFFLFILAVQPGRAVEPCMEEMYNGDDVVKVPVRLKFESPAYQTDWVYRGLPMTLHVQGDGLDYADEGRRIEDMSLLSFFCIYVPPGEKNIGGFKLVYGAKDILLTPRVVNWASSQEVPSGMKKYPSHKMFAMQEISVLRLPDPNWVIFKSATLNRDSKGVQLLDVEFWNPTSTDLPGGELSIASDPGTACAAAGPELEVPVSLTRRGCVSKTGLGSVEAGRCEIEAAAPDPGGTRPLVREFHTGFAGCGEYYAHLDVGPTGVFPKDAMTKLRYVFAGRNPSLTDILHGNVPGLSPDRSNHGKHNFFAVEAAGAIFPRLESIQFGAGVE
jgi:hypothetical protein